MSLFSRSSRRRGQTRTDRARRLHLEPLEPRRLLAAGVIISEFLAQNDAGLRDADDRSPDWIELYNAGDQSVDLEGYHLTDDPTDRDKWAFPTRLLDPGQYLVVFASGQDTGDDVDAEGNLHTNFALRRSGEYLGLVGPDGQVVSEYGLGGSSFPEQLANVSYGVAQKSLLISADSDAQYWVPLDGSVESQWMDPPFDAPAHGFELGKAAIGYESRPNDRTNFAAEIKTAVRNRSHAIYVRIPFDLDRADAVRELKLRLKYDNGFIAYLNGVPVARDNAPDRANWFSSAPENRPRDAAALAAVEFDLGDHLGALVDGPNVLAVHVLNHLPDDSDLLLVPEMIAVIPDTNNQVGYMPEPSPGRANGAVVGGFVADTRFSVDRGFYDTPQTVEITTATDAATVYYTTDGTAPGPSNPSATVYAEPLVVDRTTTLRAAAYRPGYLPTNVDTQTYIFPNDVTEQPKMLRRVTQDPVWGPQMRESLLALPTVSITAGNASLLGQRVVSQEIPVSVELIFPDGTEGFQVNAGLEHYGGHTLANSPKKNIRLSFKSQYGPPKLQYDLFGGGATDTFDQLLLRTGSHDNWFWTHPATGNQGIYIRNRWTNDRQLEMGQPAPHGRFVHVYLDGTYWGMHQLMERPNASFMASYFGGDKGDYDALNGGTPIDGDAKAWNQLRQSTGDYDQLLQYLDPVNYADYMLLQFYGGNDWDWNASQNWVAARKREEGAGWKFFSWDNDLVLRTWLDRQRSERVNVVNRGGPGNLWRQISRHEEFRVLLADRAQRYFFNGGILTTERVKEQLRNLADQVRLPLLAETARWDPQYTPDTWQEQVDRVINDMVDGRNEIVIDQMRKAGVFPRIDAPNFLVDGRSQFGGIVGKDSRVSLAADAGTVYYTTDGTDPRLAGGAISPTAIEMGAPFPVRDGQTIKARTLHAGEWSARTETEFRIQSDFGLRIAEINYHPHDTLPLPGLGELDRDNDAFEFIELTNVSDVALDIGGAQLVEVQRFDATQGVSFAFDSQMLQPGGRVVVVRDRAAFQSRYGTDVRLAQGRGSEAATAGEFDGDLSDDGELLTLLDPQGNLIDQFTYDVGSERLARAQGHGSSLETVDSGGSDASARDWQASVDFGGSPGREGRRESGVVVINEVMPHGAAPDGDAIELYNGSYRDVDVSGWYFSNTEQDYFRYRLPLSEPIPGRSYRMVIENQFGFPLDGSGGGRLWLIQADDSGRPVAFADEASFAPTSPGVSVGRRPDGLGALVPMAEVTWAGPNASRRIGDVIVSEVHFSPLDPDRDRPLKADDFEFVELYNRTDRAVDLSTWRITGSVEFTFPAATILPPRSTLVVVPFRPTNVAKSNVFRFYLRADASLPLYGPYRPSLDDKHNVIRLEKAELSPPDAPGPVPYVLIDQVQFNDRPPWPQFPEEGGQSLTRRQQNVYGTNPIAWTAAEPSPGTVKFSLRVPGDANDDRVFDQADFDQVLAAGKYLTGVPATWSEGDWNGDGVFDPTDVVTALQSARSR